MANSFRVEFYKSAKVLSYFVIGIFVLIVGCLAIEILFSLALLKFPDSTIELDDGSSTPIFYLLIGLVGIVELLARIAAVVLLLIWEYRAFSNLSPLKARNLEFSPGWAVGWWFIPFMNLVKPYRVMKELWRGSDPDLDPQNGLLSSSPEAPSSLGFWWGLFLISNIFGRFADKTPDNQITTVLPVVVVASCVAGIAAAAILISIVRDITKRQEERFARVNSLQLAGLVPPALGEP